MTTKKRTKFIPIPTDGNKIIRKKFKCTQVTVWSALNYVTNSELAISIREFAINKWGNRPLVRKTRFRK